MGGTPEPQLTMKSATMVTLLNTGGASDPKPWFSDLTTPINSGYPILICQKSFNLNVSGPTNGSINLSSGTYSGNTVVNLTATPSSGYFFLKWIVNGNDSINENISINMVTDYTVQAVFEGLPVTTGISACGSFSGTITASGAGSGEVYRWYSDMDRNNLLYSGLIYTPAPITETTTLYVTIYNSTLNKESDVVPVTVTINTIPIITSAYVYSSNPICSGFPVTLYAASDQVDNISWYDAGYNNIGTGNYFTTGDLNTSTNFYAEADNGTCVSDKYNVSVAVNSGPAINTPPQDKTICFGNMPSFSVDASGAGLQYQWLFWDSGSQTWLGGDLWSDYGSGDNTNTLTLNGNASEDGMQVECIITTEDGCSVTTNPATLHIIGPV